MIYILYSGDYEVFMGGNYLTESDILIQPTLKALDTFDSINAPVTLFADLLCLWRYREVGLSDFPDEVDTQLKEIIRRGHDVQMHLHPHWPKTKINKNKDGSTHYQVDQKWLYPQPHLQDIYEFMRENLANGKEYLDKLLTEVSPEYRCVAYRAGAYGIMPGESDILGALEDTGYLIDSSVVPGYPGMNPPQTQIVKFDALPSSGNYWLSREFGLSREAQSGIYEIPVAATEIRELLPLLRLKIKSISTKIHGKPKLHAKLGYTLNEGAVRNEPNLKMTRPNKLKSMIKGALATAQWRMMDITDDANLMLDLTNIYIKRYQNTSEHLFFSVSFHPKDFFPNKHEALIKYHQALLKRYGDNIQAITFSEAAALIPKPSKR